MPQSEAILAMSFCYLDKKLYNKYMHKAHQIKNIKRKAYIGINGAKRKHFCDEYQRVLPQIYSNLKNGFVKTLKEGEEISCKEGCFYCCYQHVGVNLAHGMLIVDYLYSHDIALKNFLNNYSKWKESVENICQTLDADFNKALQDRNPKAILEHCNHPLSSEYFDIQAPCPLLLNSHCSIYKVRPLNCAGHYSTSPCEWCAKDRTEEPNIRESLPSHQDMMKIFKLPYVTPELMLFQFTMPIMVYELLVSDLPVVLIKFGINGIFT